MKRHSLIPACIGSSKKFLVLAILFTFAGCTDIGVFEKNISIPGYEWSSQFTPSVSFEISDTSALYDAELVIRHNEKYHFSNIWVGLSIRTPTDSIPGFQVEKTLATNEAGWLGTGMDDIYEHRIPINEELTNHNVSFRKAGTYTFTFHQIMREDPLLNIMNIGLHIEKKR